MKRSIAAVSLGLATALSLAACARHDTTDTVTTTNTEVSADENATFDENAVAPDTGLTNSDTADANAANATANAP